MSRLPGFQTRFLLPILAAICLTGLIARASGDSRKGHPTPPPPKEVFSPSNARTAAGGLIPVEQFFSAKRCAGCHQDTHAAWSESLHRNAAREPFYKESVDILERTRGSEAIMHCEACHSPVAVVSGSLLKENNQADKPPGLRPFEDEGITCSVCHSITEARLDGTGSYTIRRPALLVREDGTPVFGDVPDAAIVADIPGHRRAMMRPLLKEPEFCATCHKGSAPPALNNYKFLRGFNAYDEWQQSGASHEVVAPFYRREQRADCRSCHMPKVDSVNDVAARDGAISSHRWLGANTAAPLFYGQTKQVELTEEFLRAQVLSVDIFALRTEASGRLVAPLSASSDNVVALQPGEEVTAEVVIANRKAAHSFPPELRDMYEPWVEFEAIDASGKTFFHSGFIKPDGTLDESAHVYKAILLDESNRPITRHQVWLARVKVYDNAIPQGRSDIARYRFRLPRDPSTNSLTSVTLRARVNYRRFIQEYTDYVLQRRNNQHLTVPVVRMAETEISITPAGLKSEKSGQPRQAETVSLNGLARRWNDYGIGLLEQAQYGAASEAFQQASRLNPRDPNPLVSAAVAEMKTEQYGLARDRLRTAAELLARALRINPTLARTRFYHALLLRSQGKPGEAASELARIALEFPRDREVARQLAQTLYRLNRAAEAGDAFETVLRIDPTDAGAYQFLAPIYASAGLKTEADQARSLYLLWRDDPLASTIATRFFAAHPQWADERVLAHTHDGDSPARPVLSGLLAAPEK